MRCLQLIVAVALLVSVQPAFAQDVDERQVTETVREMGVLESARAVDVRNNVRGRATVLWLAPEGTTVREGDLLVELDDGELQQRVLELRIEIDAATAELEAAAAEFKAAKEEGEARVSLAKKTLTVALVEKERVLGDQGELATMRAELEAKIEVAEARHQVLQRRMKSFEGDEDKGLELHLAHTTAFHELKAAKAKLAFVLGPETKKRQLASELAIAEAEFELRNAENRLKGSVQAAGANLAAKEGARKIAQDRLEQARSQLKLSKVRAPQAGVVLYPVVGRGGDRLEEGATVRERQTLVRLPDMSRLQMRVLVNESQIVRVRKGQNATIQLDAFPGASLSGKVTQVSRVAEPASWFKQDVREYAVTVELEDAPENAKLGLTGVVIINTGSR